LVAIITCLGWVRFAAAADPPSSVRLELGADWASVVAAQPPGTSYIVAAGVHRGVGLVPKDGDTITGEPGAVLNGCLQLTEWTQDGEFWVHPAPVILPDWPAGGLFCSYDICRQPQDLYSDDRLLQAVEAPELIAGESNWFLDKENTRILVKFDPRQREMEFGGPTMVAINCLPQNQPVPAGVVIENLKIEKYPARPQTASVIVAGGALLRNCDISYSHGYGVSLGGPATIRDCYIHHNGMCGIGGGGEGGVVEGNEIAYNVWPYYAGRAWDNGGVKISNARNITFRRNYVHHNAGPGIWTDIKTTDVLMEDNIVEFNDWEGLLPELSNHFTLRRNICRWNGVSPRPALWGAQICVQNSSYMVIEDNYLETGPGKHSPWGNPQGVMVINQNVRKLDEGHFEGDFGVHDIIVRRNTHVMPQGGHNGVDYGSLGWNSFQDFLDAGLVWRENRYFLGRPLLHLWSWRFEPTWENTISTWLRWEPWSVVQDAGSSLTTFGPDTYPPTGDRQHALIKEATGHDYPILKASLTRKPPPPTDDLDANGLPDAWERHYFVSSTVAEADPDADGLTNLQELNAGTSPTDLDSDDDGLPDGWEKAKGSNPLVYDSGSDPDGDGLTAREQYEDESQPVGGAPGDPAIPQSAIKLWLTPSSGIVASENADLVSWRETGPMGVAARWEVAPRLSGLSPSGAPLVDTANTAVRIPATPSQWGDPTSGWTMTFVFQPSILDDSRTWRGLLTNEAYLQSGFRLRLESGYLVWTSTQSGGSVSADGHTRLAPGQTYVITLMYGGATGHSALYVNGVPEAFGISGTVVPGSSALVLGAIGGVETQPGRFGDVAVFNRRLLHSERKTVEMFLREKYITGLAVSEDRDHDGLPDAWEVAHELDALTPNAFSDKDGDGLTNLAEYQANLNPQVADTDADGLPDGWEVAQGTNPREPDAGADPDEDGLSNIQEFENGTDPLDPNGDPFFLPFSQLRVWWRANHGLDGNAPTAWTDSSASRNPARATDPADPLPLEGAPLAGWRTVRLGGAGLESSQPISADSGGRSRGVTATIALRPPATPSVTYGRLLVWGDVVVGVRDNRLVLENSDGSRTATAAATLPDQPFILSCVASHGAAQATLFVNGMASVSLQNVGTPLNNTLIFGGTNAWPAEVAEIIVHAETLAPIDRRFLERVLQAKWLGTGPLVVDSDGDALPDWWEHEALSDPAVPDAQLDSDWDGSLNLDSFQTGRPGFVWLDEDRDHMHDGWELAHGLDASRADAHEDPDSDGLVNGLEHALLLPPRVFTPGDAWFTMEPTSSGGTGFFLRNQASQRSWLSRPQFQLNSELLPDGWIPAPAPAIVGRRANALAIEETVLTPDAVAPLGRQFIRMQLVNE
jgi:hypothetical protein